ncbi:MAG: hypothetical protein ABIC91_08755 [Nanoarchaeota archaeon]
MKNEQTNGFGTIMGIIIVVIVLIVGAFYFVGQRMEKQKEFQAAIQIEIATTSDEITDIESSANSMDFDDLGTGIDNL